MTVGFFSPLPPDRTGVAEYSESLLRALRRFGHVTVAPESANVNLYHIGNNQLHRSIYERALKTPGVVVLHDAVLHHFLLGSLSQDQYESEFVYNYGDWNRSLAASLWAGRALSGVDDRYFRYGMLRRLVERSLAIVVHNAAAAASVRAHVADANVVEIPHLFDPPSDVSPHDLRVPRGTVLFGIFGHLRESKRVLQVLRLWRRLPEPAHLLIAGEWVSRDLAKVVEPLLEHPRIHRVGFTPDREFWSLARRVDACINLRYPSAAETSGIGVRLMGLGRTVLATSGPEMAGYPPGSYLPIEGGLHEAASLELSLHWLLRSPSALRDIGAFAARHIAQCHSPEHVAGLYWQCLRDAIQ